MSIIKGRVRVAREKAEFVRSLKASENPTAPFQTYSDIIAFAAALGAKRGRRIPLEQTSRKDPDPIPQEQFFNRGYETLFNLLTLTSTQNLKVLLSSENYEDLRIQLIEEYANAGLEILQHELTGVFDYAEHLLLMLQDDRSPLANQATTTVWQ